MHLCIISQEMSKIYKKKKNVWLLDGKVNKDVASPFPMRLT